MAIANTRYANFNALTVTGRIFNAEIVTKTGSPFLAVSVISTATKDGEDLVYTFTDSAGLMSLHNNGQFNTGREVTITGHITGVRTAYKTADGAVKLLKRPEVRLQSVTCLAGGLGRMPQTESTTEDLGGMTITIDEAPEVTPRKARRPVQPETTEVPF